MKNILEQFLDEIEVPYTRSFADKLYNEHPHKYNMYGLKKMFDVYRVKTLGVRIESKDPSSLNYPCILHFSGDFFIGLDCGMDKITYLKNGKKTTLSHDVFKQIWTGNALVVEETTEAEEPEYKNHQQEEMIAKIKAYLIPIMLLFSSVLGIVAHIEEIGFSSIIGFSLNSIGILVCALLMQKQLLGKSLYGDRVCSLFHHADCNSILDGPKAKIFGISWSEVGLGYFIASILLTTLYQESVGIVAIINWIAMFYGVWSIYYQWRIAKSWCVLCVITQIIIWLIGIVAIIACISAPLSFSIISCLLSCMTYGICILAVHHYAVAHDIEKARIRDVQQYRALKANNYVAKAIIEEQEYFDTSLDDSSILFGNPEAKMRVTILSNPHCNPCARMHERIDRLLDSCADNICIQYIFSSFNEQLEDSSRFLIYCYDMNNIQSSREAFKKWYAGEKTNHEVITKKYSNQIHNVKTEEELNKHKEWRKRTKLSATPTILVNGFELPTEYEIEDLEMIAETY